MEATRPHEVYNSFPNHDVWIDWLTGQRDSDDSGFMEGEEEELPPPPAVVPARQVQKPVRRR
jgi:hypothetical protein